MEPFNNVNFFYKREAFQAFRLNALLEKMGTGSLAKAVDTLLIIPKLKAWLKCLPAKPESKDLALLICQSK